jgi:hypothetical protein
MTFDGRFADVVATMCTQIGPALAAVWRCAAGCPNIDDVGAVTQWLQHHRVPAALPFSTRAASVHDIRAAVAARDRLRAFVVRAQSMTNAELFAAFRRGGDAAPSIATTCRPT